MKVLARGVFITPLCVKLSFTSLPTILGIDLLSVHPKIATVFAIMPKGKFLSTTITHFFHKS